MNQNLKKVSGGGGITFLRAAEMDKGQKVAGVYVQKLENKFNEKRFDHKIQLEDGTFAVINGTGQLDSAMGKIKLGQYVEVIYAGKATLAKGKFAGKEAHNFDVYAGEIQPLPTASKATTLAPIDLDSDDDDSDDVENEFGD